MLFSVFNMADTPNENSNANNGFIDPLGVNDSNHSVELGPNDTADNADQEVSFELIRGIYCINCQTAICVT